MSITKEDKDVNKKKIMGWSKQEIIWWDGGVK